MKRAELLGKCVPFIINCSVQSPVSTQKNAAGKPAARATKVLPKEIFSVNKVIFKISRKPVCELVKPGSFFQPVIFGKKAANKGMIKVKKTTAVKNKAAIETMYRVVLRNFILNLLFIFYLFRMFIISETTSSSFSALYVSVFSGTGAPAT